MRILKVIHYPTFGGPHNTAAELYAPLAALGVELEVVIPDEPGNAGERLEASGVPVIRQPLRRMRATANVNTQARFASQLRSDVRRLEALIRERDFDVVLIGGLVNPHGAVAGRRAGAAVVWQLLDTRPPLAFRRLMMPLVVAMSDAAMTTGEMLKDHHPGVERLGERVVPYFPPVDVTRFAPDAAKRRSAREELGLPGDAFVVGNVSNINPMKGHGTFVEAAARLRREHPDVRFAILGASHDTHEAYERDLLEKATAAGLELGVDLVVRDPGARVAELAQAFDVFWLTSEPRSEGTPTVVEEAMALGLPVVTADVGAVRELVDDGQTGRIVAPLDAAAFAEATSGAMRDPDALAAMARSARAVAETRFSAEESAAAHVRAFEVALAHRRVRRAAALGAAPAGAGSVERLRELVVCPVCRGDLEWTDEAATCSGCAGSYAIADGIPILLPAGSAAEGWQAAQADFFDSQDAEFETSRPHGTPRMYRWLLGTKFARSVDGVAPALDGATALTVCGGSGMDAEYLARAGAHVIASDISLGAVRRARERAERHALSILPIVADVERLPFRERSVDVVYVHDGLHHLEAPVDGLREMARVSRDVLSLTEPARAAATALAVRFGLAEEVEEAGNVVGRMELDEIETVLGDAGFDVLARSRYAMLYRQEPGPIMRALSTRVLWPIASAALRVGNRAVGRFGNKLTVQARRRRVDAERIQEEQWDSRDSSKSSSNATAL